MALESVNGEEPVPLDVEEGEIRDESGGSDGETEPNKSEEPVKKSSKSSGTSRSSKNKESAGGRKRTESSSDHGKAETSRRGGNKHSNSNPSKTSDKKRSGGKFDDEKDGKKKASKKPKEDTTFEDELNEYKQLNSSRSRRQSDDSDSADPNDPNAKRPQRPPRFQGNGPGNRPFKRRKEEFRPKEKKVACKFFMEGRCKYGDECPFSHNIVQQKKLEACKFYMSGFCQKGNNCVYLHGEFPCKFFHTGQQCYAGDTCKFSHGVLNGNQKMALDRLLEKENNFLAQRHQARREEFERAQHKEGVNGEAARDSKVFLDNLSRDLQGPGDGPAQGPPGTWNNNNRRRPEFFRDTLSGGDERRHSRDEDYPVPEGGPGEHSDEERYDNVPPGERVPRPQPYPQAGNPSQDSRFSPGSTPHSSQNDPSDNPVEGQDVTQRMPKKQRDLYMRLQQRAQQSASRQADGEDPATEPISSESLDEGRARLTIEDAEPEEPERPKLALLPNVSHWNESDDEDDGSDQMLVANSLKRLQEAPRQSRWGPTHPPVSNGLLPPPRAQYSHPPPNYSQPPPYPQNSQPFYPQQETYFEPRPAPGYHGAPEEEPNRRKTLLPLPPPGHEPVRQGLLAPPSETYHQFAPPPYQGGLLPPPVQQASLVESQYGYVNASLLHQFELQV